VLKLDTSSYRSLAVVKPLNLTLDGATVDDYFSLSKNQKRGIFEADIIALILYYTKGAVDATLDFDSTNQDDPLVRCGRYYSKQATRVFQYYRQIILDKGVELGGTCTNCFYRSSANYCSFVRTSRIPLPYLAY
jgi:hypothetical protein